MSSAFPPPRPVEPGSTIGLVAPAGPFDRGRFEAGVAWLRERYTVRFDDDIFEKTGYFAGSDARRLRELRDAIRDPEIDAILCARGGYGATRLLPDLVPAEVAAANKALVGFSDITALHALWARAGVRSIHAPMAGALAGATEPIREEWIRTLEGRDAPETWTLQPIVAGAAEGRLFGGNLAVIAALLGTPFLPRTDGCVLFLEDVGERPYRVDRMLTSLLHAGWFAGCAGIVIGAFTEGKPGDDGVSTEEVIAERLGNLGVPVIAGFPGGHIDDNEPLTFGAAARIDGDRFTISA
ncbi:MAG: LD-carboxypeptidase [Akkermansiaceae bacterium]|nr:LD-carboxypeptidase [Akkermansiaceae bacterium]